MDLTLHVWRQKGGNDAGRFETYEASNVSPDMSFLEMLDMVNDNMIRDGKEPFVFDSDCREGICGTCSLVINGRPHGPEQNTTVCQLHMRHFTDGQEIWIEPWRAKAFPILQDLIVDRSTFDRIIQSGGFVTVSTGGVPDANDIQIPKQSADYAMDAAECIGCGACVAACPNGSAMLFVAAKVAHLAELPQGKVEAAGRVQSMVDTMHELGFGNCSNHYECQAACPKDIDVQFISRLNWEYIKSLTKRK